MRNVYTAGLFVILLIVSVVAYAATATPTSCSVCGAKITEADMRFSLYITEGMEAHAFDDIGCAVIFYADLCASRSMAFDNFAMVRDYGSGEDVPVDKAFYVRGANIKTPRGYGIVAFKTMEAAKSFASGQGATLLKYSEFSSLKLK